MRSDWRLDLAVWTNQLEDTKVPGTSAGCSRQIHWGLFTHYAGADWSTWSPVGQNLPSSSKVLNILSYIGKSYPHIKGMYPAGFTKFIHALSTIEEDHNEVESIDGIMTTIDSNIDLNENMNTTPPPEPGEGTSLTRLEVSPCKEVTEKLMA